MVNFKLLKFNDSEISRGTKFTIVLLQILMLINVSNSLIFDPKTLSMTNLDWLTDI